jgi:hypothetical protein
MTGARSFATLLCAAGAFLLSTQSIADTGCSKQPVDAEHVQMIGRDMLVNGVPTSVFAMEFAGSPDDVSNQFRAFWTREQVPAKGRRDASGLLLSALDGTCHYVLVVPHRLPGASTKGLMSVMRLDNEGVRHRVPDALMPMLDDATRVSDVESRDPHQAGRTWLVNISGAAADVAQRYRRAWEGQGWAIVANAPAYRLDGSQRVMGDALAMQRGADRIDAIFSDHSGHTEAVIHATTSNH